MITLQHWLPHPGYDVIYVKPFILTKTFKKDLNIDLGVNEGVKATLASNKMKPLNITIDKHNQQGEYFSKIDIVMDSKIDNV